MQEGICQYYYHCREHKGISSKNQQAYNGCQNSNSGAGAPIKLIKKSNKKHKPAVFIYIPYAIPEKQNPVKIRIVYGNAVFNALSFIKLPAFC